MISPVFEKLAAKHSDKVSATHEAPLSAVECRAVAEEEEREMKRDEEKEQPCVCVCVGMQAGDAGGNGGSNPSSPFPRLRRRRRVLFLQIVFAKIDVDVNEDLASRYSIRAVPTFHIFVNGKKVNEVMGSNTKALEAVIEELSAD